jgi:hypothetical protein
LSGCEKDRAMPATNILHRSKEETYLDCARKCGSLFEGCGWMNYKEDATTDNCELGKTPRDAECSHLEQRVGTRFYFKVGMPRLLEGTGLRFTIVRCKYNFLSLCEMCNL